MSETRKGLIFSVFATSVFALVIFNPLSLRLYDFAFGGSISRNPCLMKMSHHYLAAFLASLGFLFCSFRFKNPIFLFFQIFALLIPFLTPTEKASGTNRIGSVMEAHPTIGYAAKPRACQSWSGRGNRECTDDFGGRAIPNRQGICEKNIFIFGDSYAWGHLVNDDETTGYFLQEEIKDRACVFIFAASGYSLGQIHLRFKDVQAHGLIGPKNAVVYLLHEDDPLRDYYWPFAGPALKPRLKIVNDRVESGGVLKVNAYLERLCFLKKIYLRIRVRAADRDLENNLGVILRELVRISSDEKFTPAVLVAIPYEEMKERLDGGPGKYYALMKKAGESAGIEFIDVVGLLKEGRINLPDASFSIDPSPSGDRHWNPRGHRFMASILFRHFAGEFAKNKGQAGASH